MTAMRRAIAAGWVMLALWAVLVAVRADDVEMMLMAFLTAMLAGAMWPGVAK